MLRLFIIILVIGAGFWAWTKMPGIIDEWKDKK